MYDQNSRKKVDILCTRISSYGMSKMRRPRHNLTLRGKKPSSYVRAALVCRAKRTMTSLQQQQATEYVCSVYVLSTECLTVVWNDKNLLKIFKKCMIRTGGKKMTIYVCAALVCRVKRTMTSLQQRQVI